MRTNYNDCENEILELYLNKELFHIGNDLDHLLDTAIDEKNYKEMHEHIMGVELIVRPECNQKCEYCYIARYGKELYPLEERVDNATILKNLDMLLTYFYRTNHAYINHFELFAGDLFYDNLYFDIMEVFLKHLKPLYEDYKLVFEKYGGLILMPSNFSFITDDEKVQKIKNYQAEFEKLNWELGFSISTDGKYMTKTREGKDLPDEYFDKLFQWTLDNPKNGFHAIISASNVKNMIPSYDWWKEMYAKYYTDFAAREHYTLDFLPYWLEARNDDWTDEAIEDYLKFIDYAFKDRFAMHDNDPEKMAYHLFKGDGQLEGTKMRLAQSDPVRIDVNTDERNAEEIGCSISNLMCITLNNFAIVPCHRLNYPQFRGGYLTTDETNSKIVGTRPFNVIALMSTKMCHSDSRPKCTTCLYKKVCHKGCLGAQFEATGEVHQPVLSVCRLFRAWYNYLILLYHDNGVLEAAFNMNLITPEQAPILESILHEALRGRQHELEQSSKGGRANGICG